MLSVTHDRAVGAEYLNRAFGGDDSPVGEADDRCLACPTRAHQGDALARIDGQVERVDGGESAPSVRDRSASEAKRRGRGLGDGLLRDLADSAANLFNVGIVAVRGVNKRLRSEERQDLRLVGVSRIEVLERVDYRGLELIA